MSEVPLYLRDSVSVPEKVWAVRVGGEDGERPRKVDIRLPEKKEFKLPWCGAGPPKTSQKHRWIRTSRLSIKNSLSLGNANQGTAFKYRGTSPIRN